MNEYAEAARKFYEAYRPIARRYNLRLHSRFSLYDDGIIKIYQGEGADKRLIVKVEEKDSALCYMKAMDAVVRWEERRREQRAAS